MCLAFASITFDIYVRARARVCDAMHMYMLHICLLLVYLLYTHCVRHVAKPLCFPISTLLTRYDIAFLKSHNIFAQNPCIQKHVYRSKKK